MAEMKMKEIPEELVTEILSYVPVKYLMRFNGVCKAWRDLFRNSDFISKHYHNRATLSKSDTSLLVKHSDRGRDFFSFVSSTFNEDGSEKIVISEIYVPFYQKCWPDHVVLGPCNGLLCLVEYGIYGKMALWNPAIRKFKILPSACEGSAGMGSWYLEEVGFGFDNKNNDYKVIAFFSLADGGRKVCRAELYSLTSESWREIPSGVSILPKDDFTFCDVLSNPYYSHGVYYWLINCNHVDHGNWIMSFDMADEVFEIMQLPDFGVSILTHLMKFAILDASIHVVVYRGLIDPGRCFDIWVTNEPGVKESWVKRATIAPISGIKDPVGFWKSGELCFEDSSNKLVLYDFSTQQVKDSRLHHAKLVSQVANYTESLVQINGRLEDARFIVRMRNRNL